MPEIFSPLLISLISLFLAFGALVWVYNFQRRLSAIEALRRQMKASGVTDVESLLESNLSGVSGNSKRLDQLETDTRTLLEAQGRSLQHVGIVRFNPYSDTGGDQSFSLALLDAHGDGVVISGLYARAGVRLYAKPIANWQSTYPLSDEEGQAIAQARRAPQSPPTN